MNKMKDSGIKWIGTIPEGWQVVSIKSFLQKRKEILEKWTDENVLSLTMNGVVIRDLENPSGKMPATFDGYQKIYKGNLVLCLFDIDVTPRCVGIAYDDGITSPAYSQYIIKEGDLRFYYYLLLMMDNDKILLQYSRTLRSTLTDEYFRAVKVAIPKSIIEQQRIAKFLDEKTALIDDIITDTKQTIEELKSYKKSLITEIVTKGINPNVTLVQSGIDWIGEIPEGWEIKKSKYFGNVRNGLTYNPSDLVSDSKGILVLRSGNIQNGKLCLSDNQYVSVEIPSKLLVKKNDILITSRNGSMKMIGKSAIIEEDLDATFGAFMMLFTPNIEINSKFFYYLLNSNGFEFYRGLFSTSTINQLTKNVFDNMVFPLPSPNEQEQIVDFLDNETERIDTLITEKENLISEYENYKKSMIYEYVTGKKRVEGYES